MISLFPKTHWAILKELSKKNTTPTELSKALKISLPAVHKVIHELLNEKFIKESAVKAGKTRPYKMYSLNEFVFFTKVLRNNVMQTFLPVDENLKIHLNIGGIKQKEFHYFIEQFWWQIINANFIHDVESFAIFGSVAAGTATEGSDIDVLTIGKESKKLKKIIKEQAIENVYTKKTRILMPQFFSKEEFIDAYKKGSKFIKEMLLNMIVIYDKNCFLTNLKDELEKGTK